MKRGFFGPILLAVILTVSLLIGAAAKKELAPIAGDVDLASETVLQEQWQKTAALTEKSRAAWNEIRMKFSCLSQQQAVREIDSLYDQVEVFLNAEEAVHCSATCADLKNHLQALLEEQKLCLSNLL